MQINELCKLINIPQVVQENILQYEKQLDFNCISNEMELMNHSATWTEAIDGLKQYLEPDEDGLKMLTCQLHAACNTYEKYQASGISDDIFVETMKFFPRFLYTYHETYSEYKYIWGWWAVRQISMQEFRIGELEYEMMTQESKKVISVHIPSDADMKSSSLRKSYIEAREFFAKYYPEFAGVDMICYSWLLAPSLKKLLPDSSNIIRFQNQFQLISQEDDSPSILDWVYGRRGIPYEDLPENTSLQRKLKAYLLNGGKMECASGTLMSDPFLEK